jgi:hypothetical protein
VRAFTEFAKLHPQWAASLFDLHFLQHRGVAVVLARSRGDYPDSPLDGDSRRLRELAEAWVSQWGFGQERSAQLVDNALPACATFLKLFDAELQWLSNGPLARRAARVGASPARYIALPFRHKS